jgi:hypothetical protein
MASIAFLYLNIVFLYSWHRCQELFFLYLSTVTQEAKTKTSGNPFAEPHRLPQRVGPRRPYVVRLSKIRIACPLPRRMCPSDGQTGSNPQVWQTVPYMWSTGPVHVRSADNQEIARLCPSSTTIRRADSYRDFGSEARPIGASDGTARVRLETRKDNFRDGAQLILGHHRFHRDGVQKAGEPDGVTPLADEEHVG